ncbi:hypothetical protein RND81_02G061800 [Saponaria officinalis]|uniref:Uncharacterized protein n=1 Tax=Saponaria officinalis TaxID=3572 RepID=A0AAW1MRJ5_SAPOF
MHGLIEILHVAYMHGLIEISPVAYIHGFTEILLVTCIRGLTEVLPVSCMHGLQRFTYEQSLWAFDTSLMMVCWSGSSGDGCHVIFRGSFVIVVYLMLLFVFPHAPIYCVSSYDLLYVA